MSASKKSTKKRSADSDELFVEELEAYSQISNQSKKNANNKNANNKNANNKNANNKNANDKNVNNKNVNNKNANNKNESKKNSEKKATKKQSESETESSDDSDSSDSSGSESESKTNVKKSVANNDDNKKSSAKNKTDKDTLGLEYGNPKSFDKAIKEWVKADNRQKEIRKENKLKKENDTLNTIKKETSQFITKTMRDEELPAIEITKGKLILNKTSGKTKLTIEFIEETLAEHFSEKQIEKIIGLLQENMEDIPRYNIKRVSN